MPGKRNSARPKMPKKKKSARKGGSLIGGGKNQRKQLEALGHSLEPISVKKKPIKKKR